MAGAKFQKVAKTESDDVSSGRKRGDLGTFGQGQMIPEFDDVVFRRRSGKSRSRLRLRMGITLFWWKSADPDLSTMRVPKSSRRSGRIWGRRRSRR